MLLSVSVLGLEHVYYHMFFLSVFQSLNNRLLVAKDNEDELYV